MADFVISEKINQISEHLERNADRYRVTDSKLPFDNKRFIKALRKLCRMWNKNPQTRNYVKYLIRKFMPFDASKKVAEFESEDEAFDAILNEVKLAGLEEITENCNRFAFAYAKSNELIDEQKAAGDYQSFENREDRIREWVQGLPFEILHADFGYYAQNCDKYLCRESVRALKKFLTIGSKMEDLEIMTIMGEINDKAVSKMKKSIGANLNSKEHQDFFASLGPLK